MRLADPRVLPRREHNGPGPGIHLVTYSAGVLLLRDIAEIFQSRTITRIGSTQLCEALGELEESPWAEWRAGRPTKPISFRQR